MKDYYETLGIQRTASDDEIKSAFRKLAQKYHPDKKGGDEAKFKEISEAYGVLSDKKRRAEYDTYGKTFAGGQGGGFQGFDFSNFAGFQNGQNVEFDLGDIFGEFFGGGAGRGQARGRDISIDIELSFHESIFGTERRVLISKTGVCETCTGTGAKKGTGLVSCTACNGKGEIRETRNSFFGSFTSNRTCPRCHGKGQVPDKPCDVCQGAGVAKREEEIHIVVPAGVQNGEMIRMPGRGEVAAGGSAGDLYVKLHVKTDVAFTREGNNLIRALPVKLTDALIGATYHVRGVEGDLPVDIPAGVVHGEMLRVKGQGVPYGRGNRGDLLVRVDIQFPKKLSREQRDLIDKLRTEGL